MNKEHAVELWLAMQRQPLVRVEASRRSLPLGFDPQYADQVAALLRELAEAIAPTAPPR